MTPKEKLDLISRYLDDALGEGDLRRFEMLMAGDPEFAGMFHELATLHARLRRLARMPEVVPATVRAGRWRRLIRGEGKGIRRLLAAAAALTVALFGIYVMVRPRPAVRPVVHRDAPAAAREGPAEISPAPPVLPGPGPVPENPPPLPPVPPPEPPPPPSPLDPGRTTAPEAPPPELPPSPRPVTEAAVARVERLEGNVSVLSPGPSPARIGQYLRAGQGLAVEGEKAAVTVLFPDGSQLCFHGGTTVSRLDDAGGRRVELRRGTLEARVMRQAEGRPMVFITPRAEAAVLGTELILSTDAGSTRLEVHEGRVRLTRTVDGAFLDVTAGHAATVAPGVPFAARPLAGKAAARPPEAPAPGTFTLIDADTGRPVPGYENLRDGTVLNLARLPRHINVRFNPPAKCASVRFGLDAQPDYWIEEGPPYLLAGDRSGRIFAWTPTPGVHMITATPYEQSHASGRPGPTCRLTVQVVRKP